MHGIYNGGYEALFLTAKYVPRDAPELVKKKKETSYSYLRSGGTGPVGQAKTGPLLAPLR